MIKHLLAFYFLLTQANSVIGQYKVPYFKEYERCNYCGEKRSFKFYLKENKSDISYQWAGEKLSRMTSVSYLYNVEDPENISSSQMLNPHKTPANCGKSINHSHDWNWVKENHIFTISQDQIESYRLSKSSNEDNSSRKLNGYAVKTYESGARYEGNWDDNNRSGTGIMYYTSGDIYKGEFRYNQENGNGTYSYINGDKYVGQFYNGNMHGTGTYYKSDGSKYEGQWYAGVKHGKGIITWPDGSSYNGDFSNDKRNGKGIGKWPDGSIYEGDYVNDKSNGNGILYNQSIKYVGQFKDDKFNGFGTLYINGVVKKSGIWVDNAFMGDGK